MCSTCSQVVVEATASVGPSGLRALLTILQATITSWPPVHKLKHWLHERRYQRKRKRIATARPVFNPYEFLVARPPYRPGPRPHTNRS